MGYLIGVDIGGTFTDCIAIDENGSVTIGKSLSTGPEFHEGFLNAIGTVAERVGMSLDELIAGSNGIYHGCTVGTNAMVEGRVADVGLLTTAGHEDALTVMRAGRRLWTQAPPYIARVATQVKPAALVPRARIMPIDERVAVDGQVVVELNEDVARKAIEDLLESGVDALAVSLLWSVANDVHERRIGELIEELAPGTFSSLASNVVRRVGEYERTVATVVNSLIGPVMNDYLEMLEQRLASYGYDRTLQIMTCSGGVIASSEARNLPLLTIGSGPVGGLIGSGALGRMSAGSEGEASVDVLTADMGGTTLDVGVIRAGQPLTRATSWHGQYEYYVPTLDVRSIGSGGGSIIRYDEDMDTMRVGPESSGARPGPACYGRGGTQPTVTDADVVLGYVNPDNFLGGEMSLDVGAAEKALAEVGERFGYDAEQTALAAIQIVESQMADAIRLASVEQGYDPRAFSLYAYGGAGPLHGAALARELQIGRVVIPLSDLAAGWSAFGVASSDILVVEEVAVSLLSPFDPEELNAAWAELEEAALARMKTYDVDAAEVTITRYADMRYRRQVNEVEVVAPSGSYGTETVDQLVDHFEREYARIFGADTGYSAAGFTAAGLRVRCTAEGGKVDVRPREVTDAEREAALRGTRNLLLSDADGRVEVPVYDAPELGPGIQVEGPSILEFPDTSVIVHPAMRAYVDRLGSVIVEL